jgi:hypothetical protein
MIRKRPLGILANIPKISLAGKAKDVKMKALRHSYPLVINIDSRAWKRVVKQRCGEDGPSNPHSRFVVI